MSPPLVLASASPRRRALLAGLGLTFDVEVADVPEQPDDGEAAERYGLRVARAKARAVQLRRPDALVLAADTEVVLDDRPLGKPDGAAAALAMLRALSGRAHEVLTAVVVLAGAHDHAAVVRTRVTFAPLTDAQLRWYVATGEPFDKAGGYGIQERGGALVASIEGSASNVVGLPLVETARLLEAAGLTLPWSGR